MPARPRAIAPVGANGNAAHATRRKSRRSMRRTMRRKHADVGAAASEIFLRDLLTHCRTRPTVSFRRIDASPF
jgi:hypothetical protein